MDAAMYTSYQNSEVFLPLLTFFNTVSSQDVIQLTLLTICQHPPF